MAKIVLIVEDDRDVRELLEFVLTDIGRFKVEQAESAEVALALVVGGLPFDILVTDRRMPGLWGEELIEELRSRGFRQPIVLLTGDVRTKDVPGADAMVLKPFRVESFISMLQAFFPKAQAAVTVP